jgi:hypothetical protein
LATNHLNCGECGNVCLGDGELCQDGVCVTRDSATDTACGEGLTRCDGECVDLLTSAVHCGECGTACVPGNELCVVGVCTSELEVDCPTGRVQCGAICCAAGETCIIGECAPSPSGACTGDLTDCNGVCVDLQTDSDHCGQCGRACASELGAGTCIDGDCACSPGTTRCDDVCVNTERDPLNCGACGTVCADDEECVDGSCAAGETACPEGQTRCGEICVDTTSDSANCSACGRACGAGEECRDNLCVPIGGGGGCKTGLIPCGLTCANPRTDANNCGACGVACAAGESCVVGECVPSGGCPAGQVQCNGECVNPNTDPDNCGRCGNLCPVSPESFNCEDGVCVEPSCAPLTKCGGLCVDLQTDPLFCGACDIACGQGSTCEAGLCTGPGGGGCLAGSGLTRCGDACVDVTKDPSNCGFCGIVCPPETTCQPPGFCFIPDSVCAARNQFNCGLFCADLFSDSKNCGECFSVCPSGTECFLGECLPSGAPKTATLAGEETTAFSCPEGQVDCGEVCVDVQIDPANCGGCGLVCAAGETCQSGECVATPTEAPAPEPAPDPELAAEPAPATCADQGLTDCAGVCVDPQTDPNNCGVCGTVCASGQCAGGLCVETVAEAPAPAGCPEGQADCGGGCIDVVSDPANCGACGNVCAADQQCSSGGCVSV